MRVAASILAIGLVGCTGASPDPEASERRDPVATPELRADLGARTDARTQYDLVAEILAARTAGIDDQAVALEKVRRGWQGRRYTWDVGFVPSLCRTGSCPVLPFDHGRDPRAVIVQGWLPELELDPSGRAALLAGCAPHAQCVFTFTATLRQLRLSGDQPTSLAFSQVEFGGFRSARVGESWIRRRAVSADPSGGTPRTAPARSRHG